MTHGDSLAIGLSPGRPVPASGVVAAMRRPRVAPTQRQCVECGNPSFWVVRIGCCAVLAVARTRGFVGCIRRRRVRSSGGRMRGGAPCS